METFFGQLSDGTEVPLYTLTCAAGARAYVTPFGATLAGYEILEKHGSWMPLVCGFNRVLDYENTNVCMGAIIGRVANRIANARFPLEGLTVELEANQPPNCTHSGKWGFQKRLWKLRRFRQTATDSFIELEIESPDGEGGFPGNVRVCVKYTLEADGLLRLDVEGQTDSPTPLNIVHHPYFNLSGDFSKTCLGHTLQIEADAYTPTDDALIPTGELRAVKGTVYDFIKPRRLGEAIEAAAAELRGAKGYDINFALRGGVSPTLRRAAELRDPASGRSLEIETTLPGFQIYTANHFNGAFSGPGNVPLKAYCAVACEAQYFPDAVNHPEFPSVMCAPKTPFVGCTTYRFKTKGN